MADGLQVWDANGVSIFNQTTQVVKFLGTATIGWSPGRTNYTGEAASGSIVDARFTQYPGHVAFWCRIDGAVNADGYDATWTQSGNSLIWTFPRSQALWLNGSLYNRPEQTIIYGIR